MTYAPGIQAFIDRCNAAMPPDFYKLPNDKQRAYAQHLRDNGTLLKLVVEPGLVHSAARARGLCPQVADAWQRFCSGAARLAGTGEV